ncbi:MAG: hypothetical protein HON70_42440 [Lentisphaerae bacterium]|nr:hypothetical protein [Lentisphaerota bacterium]
MRAYDWNITFVHRIQCGLCGKTECMGSGHLSHEDAVTFFVAKRWHLLENTQETSRPHRVPMTVCNACKSKTGKHWKDVTNEQAENIDQEQSPHGPSRST